MDAEQFLANLVRGIAVPTTPTHQYILPPEVEFAASRGLKLAPSRGQSRFASAASTQLGHPTADLVRLQTFAARLSMVHQWLMAADGVVVLEYSPAVGNHTLYELCDGDWDGWSETLQFRAGFSSTATRFLLFRHEGQKLRALGPRAAGLRLHSSGTMVPVPPSRFLSGPPLMWVNSAVIEEIPWFLLDQNGDGGSIPPIAAMPASITSATERCNVYSHYSL